MAHTAAMLTQSAAVTIAPSRALAGMWPLFEKGPSWSTEAIIVLSIAPAASKGIAIHTNGSLRSGPAHHASLLAPTRRRLPGAAAGPEPFRQKALPSFAMIRRPQRGRHKRSARSRAGAALL